MAKTKAKVKDLVGLYLSSLSVSRVDTNIGRCYATSEEDPETYRPSVTTIENIISKGKLFEVWLANFGGYDKVQKYVGKKADDGTLVHDYIDELILNGSVKVEEDTEYHIKKYIQSFQAFWDEHKPIPVASELMLYHKGYFTSGTCDFIGYIDGKLAIIDWKTGNEYPTSHRIQLCAYKELFNMIFPNDKIEEIYGLYIKGTWRKKPTFKLRKNEYDPNITTSLWNLWKFNVKCNRTKIAKLREGNLPNDYKIEGALNGK